MEDKFTPDEINEAITNNVCKCCNHYNEGKFSQFCEICQVSEIMQVVITMQHNEE